MKKRLVGIRELKNDLSRWVAQVRAGEEIVVTDRGTAVARLVPVDATDPYARLVAEGVIERATRPHRGVLPRRLVRLRGRGPLLSDYVIAGRR
jgi:prevent-host-death family protein